MRTLVSTIILVGLLGLVRYVGLPKQVRGAIERSGSVATGQDVDVDNLRLRLLAGDILFGPLEVDMGDGFESDYAVRIDRVEVYADLTTVLDPVVVVDSMRLIGAHVVVEQRGLKISARDLVASLRTQVADTTEAFRFVVRTLEVGDARASISTQFGARDVGLPDLSLRNVGSEAGEPLETLWKSILEPLLMAVISASSLGGAVGLTG